MNSKPRYIAAHMRARMGGYTYATCFNCSFFVVEKRKKNWCSARKHIPEPGRVLDDKLCKKYTPDTHE